VYGDDAQASRIASANPGVSEPLAAGIQLYTPPQFEALTAKLSANDDQAVIVRLGGKVFRHWTEARLTLSLDSMDTLELIAPFDTSSAEQRAKFRPFSFQTMQVQVGRSLAFNGTMVGTSPQLSASARTVELSAYSLPGVLNDCTVPASDFPLEFNGLGLKAIAAKVVAPFGLKVEFEGEPGPTFERVALKPSQTVLSFLATLARQRNLVITNTPEGALLFVQSKEQAKPVANFTEGSSPLYGVSPFFSPQAYYSHITGIEVIVVGVLGSQHTVRNPRLAGTLRPYNFQASDVTGAELKTAVEAKAGRMFANMVSYQLNINTWRDEFGEVWRPNTFITLEAPGAMVYSKTTLLIRSVELVSAAETETATLDVVLPGAFNGKAPEAFPWD